MKTFFLLSFFISQSVLASDVDYYNQLKPAAANPGPAENITQEKVNEFYLHAAKNGDMDSIKRLFKHKAVEKNYQDTRGFSALIYAAYYGHKETVSYLLKNEVDPCLKDRRGNTATMGAIFKGNFRIARLLIESSCSVNQLNENGQSPLMFASLFDRTEIAKLLLENGADTGIADHSGITAKALAEDQGNRKMAELLDQGKKTK